ncbi:MAG: chemotaxis protein CheA [Aulosira sp. ZfuVER01]|nr:chemotaxis protein CheA [Aulosira sp. ZfuVER01]MDZ7999101.1 chemotaxis protein CheA [Aulosira sp. DedVER01a]MDZ8051175.1 chemotaxis protein CheA [Aulosira sp. ZfuCHP01]
MSTTDTETNNLFVEFLDDYFAESEEHLAVIRQNLLTLEAFVDRSSIERSLVDELFRSFHTLKGLSGMVGLKEAEQLAHQMESYLRELRDNQVVLTAQGMDALIGGTKMLDLTIANHRTHNPLPDIAPAIAKLTAVFTDDSSPTGDGNEEIGKQGNGVVQEAKTTRCEADQISPAVPLLKLKPEESAQIAAALASGKQAWCFTFMPNAALAQRGINVNNLRQRLQSIGELIHASPRMTATGGVVFDFVVATQTDPETFASWHEDGLSFTPYLEEAREQEAGEEQEKIPAELPPSVVSLPISPSASSPVTPATASSNFVRVDLARLDELMRMVGELVISRARLEDNLNRLPNTVPALQLRTLRETNLMLERQLRELREGVMRVRLVQIGEIFARMQFVIRDIARESQKQIALELSGQDTEIDKFVVERMMEPLLHLVRNAVSHGLESETERIARGKSPAGTIALRASTAGEMVVIEIEDDGRGVDLEKVVQRARSLGLIGSEVQPDAATVLDIICSSGFSTREEADLTSGRGVGMAVVKNTVQELGGFLTLDTQVGIGTRFRIQLPLTLAIADALIVSVGGQTFAVPQSSVREVLEIQPNAIAKLENNEIFSYRGSVLPLVRLAGCFGLAESQTTGNYRCWHAIVVGNGLNAVAILVDRIVGQQEIVVRPLTDPLVQVMGIAGATELGDGRVVLILDTSALLQVARLASLKVGKLKSLKAVN